MVILHVEAILKLADSFLLFFFKVFRQGEGQVHFFCIHLQKQNRIHFAGIGLALFQLSLVSARIHY